MDVRRSWTRGCAVATAVLVAFAVVAPASVARAEAAFRKKKAPAGDSASPSGGETEGEVAPATEGETPAPPPAPKTEYAPQADDRDRPREPSLIDKQAADAALVAKQKQQKKDEGPPWYTNWKVWAIVGVVVVGGVGVYFGANALSNAIGGGDVRGCNPDFKDNCFGAGH